MRKADQTYRKNAGLVPEAKANAKLRKDVGDDMFPVYADAKLKGIKNRRKKAQSEKLAGY